MASGSIIGGNVLETEEKQGERVKNPQKSVDVELND